MIFSITSAAEEELSAAIRYYREIDHALAVRFLREFETVIDRVLRFPESGHFRGELYRIALIRGYPYCVAYTVEGENLIVEAVAHLRRGPDYWKQLVNRR